MYYLLRTIPPLGFEQHVPFWRSANLCPLARTGSAAA
jgi:hypothetical protein